MPAVKVFLRLLSAFSQKLMLAEKRAVIKDLVPLGLNKGIFLLIVAEIVLVSDHFGYGLYGGDVVYVVELHHKPEDVTGRAVFRRAGEAFEDLFVRGDVQRRGMVIMKRTHSNIGAIAPFRYAYELRNDVLNPSSVSDIIDYFLWNQQISPFFGLLELNLLFNELDKIVDVYLYLFHRVPVSDGDHVSRFGIKVDRDAVRCADCILSSVALAD